MATSQDPKAVKAQCQLNSQGELSPGIHRIQKAKSSFAKVL